MNLWFHSVDFGCNEILPSVELWETEVCFLHIQLPKCTRFRPTSISNLLSHWQNQSLETIPIDIVAQCFPHDHTVWMALVWWMWQIKRATFVISFGPFRYRTGKLIHWPQNIKATNTGKIKSFQNNLSAYFWQFSKASTIQAYFVLCCPTLPQVSLCWWSRILQGIASGIGVSHFLQPIFIIRLNSSSSDSIKKLPRKLLELSSLGFLMAHCCFLCVSMHQPYASTYLAIHCRILRSFVSSSIFTRTVKIRQVAFRSTKWISWNLTMHPIILFLHQSSSNRLFVSPTSHLHWYR